MKRAAPLLVLLALAVPPAPSPAALPSPGEPCASPSCHGDVRAHALLHEPVAEGECGACHIPAAEPSPGGHGAASFLQPGREEAICLPCHRNTVEKMKVPSPHRSVASGVCTACHNPHGSQYPFLLVAPYSSETYAAYGADRYRLCWICHEESLAGEKFTSSSTGFRMGRRNFHYAHLRRRRGMACRACHEPHGTHQERLVRREGPSGEGWNSSMRFLADSAGGRCVGGCHRDISYRR